MAVIHVFFEGHVQGVGFRYTSRDYGRRHGLTGWVRNLPDGRVELSAQGERKDLENFLKDLESRFNGFIRNTKLEWMDSDIKCQTFDIAF